MTARQKEYVSWTIALLSGGTLAWVAAADARESGNAALAMKNAFTSGTAGALVGGGVARMVQGFLRTEDAPSSSADSDDAVR